MEEGVVRMDAQKWALVAEMNAVMCRVEAMKQLNEARRSFGYSDGYTESDFFKAEEDLNFIAQKLRVTI